MTYIGYAEMEEEKRMRGRYRGLAACILTVLMVPAAASGDVLSEMRKSGRMLWGGDQEGGGPYVYPKEDNPAQVTGFDVDVANRLGEYLKLKAEFTQGQWETMPDMLRARKVDAIINGYEFTPERAELMDATIPYYVFALQLMGRKGDARINSWADLKKGAGAAPMKIGVLSGSAAESYARAFCGGLCEVLSYAGTTDGMREVETGKLDATLQDTPVTSFYAPRFPALRRIGEPVARGYYVIYVRKGETAFLQALNEAIVLMVRNGDFERIYRKYGIWNAQQAELADIAGKGRFYGYLKAADVPVEKNRLPAEAAVRLETRKRGWQVVRDYSVILLQSAGMTVLLSCLSFPLAILLGLMIALGRLYGHAWLRLPLTGYVEFLRGTPLMLQLYFIFFFLPELGMAIPPIWTGILGLAINYSAYESEIYRAGLQAIPKGQMEAALALGMSKTQALRRIIVPQAVRIVIPPVVNDFIALFKDTSVCSVVTIVELTKRFSVLSLSTQATVELMGLTALLYLMMSYPMSVAARHIENRLGLEPQS
ncbi:MAG: ABC transporter permease subunit [Acidobacteria bacterium]|nr:ABC transporter permease subunit [Acidobacteriota bacterium]